MQLPPGVDEHRLSMIEIVVPLVSPLRPISEVVRPHHPERPAHTHERANPNQCAIQPAWAFKVAMDQPLVEANTVTEQKRRTGQDKEYGE